MAMKGLNYYTKDEVDELLGGQGGFMKKSVYDTNDSGVVDNAEKVNNHTDYTSASLPAWGADNGFVLFLPCNW